jgi:methionyl aminopeptidase
MSNLKNSKEIEIMRKAGQITAEALREVEKNIKIGVSTRKLDQLADTYIKEAGAESSFKKVNGYKHTICTTQNDWVVHGIPGNYVLGDGDVVGVDIGAYYKGYHSDMAHTYMIGDVDSAKKRFLETGEKTLWRAITEAKVGNKVGDISDVIQTGIEGAGYSVVKELVGHGVGKELHEDPLVPGIGKKGTGPDIKEGMVLAIEIIYNFGKPQVVLLKDGWTIATKDRDISGLFERTIAVTKKGPVVLTQT